MVFWTKCGGAGLPFLASMPGKMRISLCAWWNRPGKKGIPTRKPSPAMACFGNKDRPLIRSARRCRCVSSQVARSAPSRPNFWSGVASDCKRKARPAFLLIWDNASWHVSKQVRTWVRSHNSQVKQEGKGVRILPFFLPTKSPWLNPIEPKWVHAKKAIVEPDGLLSAKLLAERICAHFGCSYEPPLSIVEEVA